MTFYLKVTLMFLWLVGTSFIGLLMALFRWGDTDLDHDYARFFCWGILKIGGNQVLVDGLEHLVAHQPCIYIGNHQGALDMATFGSIYPKHTIVIGKKELIFIPIFGLFFKAAGNILIDRKNRAHSMASLAKAVQAAKQRGLSIWIFPEGTRNQSDEPLLPFKKGAFYMAIQAQLPIVPILSQPIQGIFNSKKRIIKKGPIRLKVLPPVSTVGRTEKDIESLMMETRVKMLEAIRGLSGPSLP